jgi:hypothetical protein
MQATARIINRNVTWSVLLKPRVGTTVAKDGSIYQNISGINAEVSDTANWYPLFIKVAEVVEVNKTSADILGSDPDFYLDLSAAGVPDFPLSMMAWVKVDDEEDTKYQPVAPLVYSPETKLLGGMNDPDAFPDQSIKIKFLDK